MTNLFNISTIYSLLAKGTGLSFVTIIYSFTIAFFLGIYIFFIYKYTLKSSFYCKDFICILPGMSIITCALMIVMNSNLFAFLGIISTISLIRFRHTLKNPLDLLFLFWALCAGVFCAVQLFYIAFLLSFFITLLFLHFNIIVLKKNSYILTIESSNNVYKELYKILKQHSKHIITKKKLSTPDTICYTFSLKTKKEDILIEQISKIPSLKSISFISYNGEYREA